MLTKEDLKALRSKFLRTIVFRHMDGQSKMELLFKHPITLQDDYENRYYINTDHIFDSYARDGQPLYYAVTSESVCDYRHDCLLKTVIGHMREGDNIKLMWRRSNQTDYLNNAGLFKDELFLIIERKDRYYQYFIQDSVTPNNSARMTNPDSSDTRAAIKRLEEKKQMEV